MSDGQRLRGIKYLLGQIPSRIPFWRQIFDYSGPDSARVTGEESSTTIMQTPVDKDAAAVEDYDLSGVAAELEADIIKLPGKTTLPQLPDVLSAVAVTFNKTVGTGTSSHPQSQQGFNIAGFGGATANPKASANGSAAILPSVVETRKTYRNRLVNCTHLFFWLPQSNTLTDVLTKCTTAMGAAVLDLPVFDDVSHQVSLKGQQVSVHADADTTVTFSISQGPAGSFNKTKAYEYGSGSSVEVGASVHVETLSPAIHASLTISSNTDSQAATATVDASAAAVVGDAGTEITAKVNTPTATSATASGSALFENGTATVAATTVTDIPKSGLRLVDVTPQSDSNFAYTKVHAVIVDMSQYA